MIAALTVTKCEPFLTSTVPLIKQLPIPKQQHSMVADKAIRITAAHARLACHISESQLLFRPQDSELLRGALRKPAVRIYVCRNH